MGLSRSEKNLFVRFNLLARFFDRCQGFCCGGECGVKFRFAMSGTQKARFKLRRRQPYTSFEHCAVKNGELG